MGLCRLVGIFSFSSYSGWVFARVCVRSILILFLCFCVLSVVFWLLYFCFSDIWFGYGLGPLFFPLAVLGVSCFSFLVSFLLVLPCLHCSSCDILFLDICS